MRARGGARGGNPAAGEKDVKELQRIVDALKSAKDNYWATEVEVQRLGAAAWIAYAKGNPDEALPLMRSAADMEDQSEKSAVTPGRVLPARELLGEMLLQSNRPAEALEAFETSEKHDPNRFRGVYGAAKAAALAGDRTKAKNYFEKLLALTYADIYPSDFIQNYVNKNYDPVLLLRLLPLIQAGQHFFHVALARSRVVGLCHIAQTNQGMELFRIYLRPAYIGKGIGRTLLREGEEFIKSRG